MARRSGKNLKYAALCRDLTINSHQCTKTKFRIIHLSHVHWFKFKIHDSQKLHTKQYALQLKLERKQHDLQELTSVI